MGSVSSVASTTHPHLRSISGIPLLGTLTDLNRIVRERNVEAVVIAIPSLAPGRLSDLVRQATNTGVHVRYLPSFLSALERAARAADMRIVDFNRLLGPQENIGGLRGPHEQRSTRSGSW